MNSERVFQSHLNLARCVGSGVLAEAGVRHILPQEHGTVDRGKRREALELLAPVYNWFTEGFDEVPLKEAKSVLDQLLSEVGSP